MAKVTNKSGLYRPSASVIIAAKSETDEDGYDYHLLLFKRTPQTEFAPKHCVFPGGVLEISDESIEWLKYFKEFGITEQMLRELVIVSDERPTLLAAQGNGCYDRFFKKSKIWARDISLRITAIRETFEEVGVLLCRKRNEFQDLGNGCGRVAEQFDRVYWQPVVHNDSMQFLQLCRQLDVVPDLWSLREWSTWRTPATAKRKFDTVYYFVALNKLPQLLPEPNEVALILWHSPITFLHMFEENIIWLPSMVYYELTRLTNMFEWKKLHNFACQRAQKGSTLLMPAYYICTDGMVGLLPGDDEYPDDPNSFMESVPVNLTVNEFRKIVKNIHRIVHHSFHDLSLDVNISPIDEHLHPTRVTLIASKL